MLYRKLKFSFKVFLTNFYKDFQSPSEVDLLIFASKGVLNEESGPKKRRRPFAK